MIGKNKTRKETPTRKVKFDFSAPEAQEVFLAGNFNNWDVNANRMKIDKTVTWRINLSLKPGRYEYRIIVDGNWTNDPSCSYCVPNEFDSQNCVRIVE